MLGMLSRSQKSKVVGGCIIVAAFVIALVLSARPATRDLPFRGRLESEWINALKYNDSAQVELWRGFGEEGVQVLIRGYARTAAPRERAYRKLNRKLPRLLQRALPDPPVDRNQDARECVVNLLSGLGANARSAIPTIIDAAT